MNMIVGRVRVSVDKSTVGRLIVFAAASFGTPSIFEKFVAAVDFSTSAFVLSWFVIATMTVRSVFSVYGQSQPLIGRS